MNKNNKQQNKSETEINAQNRITNDSIEIKTLNTNEYIAHNVSEKASVSNTENHDESSATSDESFVSSAEAPSCECETSPIESKELDDKKSKKKKSGNMGLIALLILPFLLFAFGVGLISVFFFHEYVETSNIWRFAVNTNAVATPDSNGNGEVFSDGETIGNSMADLSFETVSKPDTSWDTSEETSENLPEQIYYDKKDFPGYKWGDLWAKISIPSIGLEEKNVYVGESNEIYKKGIGKRFGTRFPGQGGNIVLGAHVTREFYDLSEMKKGDRIYIETGYGSYIYEVYETVIFSITDYRYVMNYDDGEKLTLYTCHPRGSAYRTERFGVLCKKISGPEWIKVD